MKIGVAVSGGVDSLYALWSLKQKGHDVFALHGRFLEKEYSLESMERQCKEWDIPFYIEDFRSVFAQKVIKPFVMAHKKLLTPNPCVFCNREVKFGFLFDKAKALGATHFATGHYVAKVKTEHGFLLEAATDNTKDQSYFLSLVPSDRLQQAIFPLADMKKDEIRKILAENSIEVPIPKESQEICFVPNDNHTQFLLDEAVKFQIKLPDSGKVELKGNEEDKKLFAKKKHKHNGLWRYTEGQRKGLGISWKEPIYVISRDKAKNALIVGGEEHLSQKECFATSTNFFVPYEAWDDEVYVRTRFRQKMLPAKVKYDKAKDLFTVEFLTQAGLTASGQILAIYNINGQLLAGGVLL